MRSGRHLNSSRSYGMSLHLTPDIPFKCPKIRLVYASLAVIVLAAFPRLLRSVYIDLDDLLRSQIGEKAVKSYIVEFYLFLQKTFTISMSCWSVNVVF